jgi:hypothetical protein
MKKIDSHSISVSNELLKGIVYCTIDMLGNDEFQKSIEEENDILSLFAGHQFDWFSLSTYLKLVMEKYGKNTSRGLSQRIGMAFFHYIRRNFPTQILTESPEARMLPFNERVKADFDKIFHGLQTEMKFQSEISGQKKEWIIELRFSFSDFVGDDNLVSFLFKGMFQEYFEWLDCHYCYRINFVNIVEDKYRLIRFSISYSLLE